MRFPIVSLTATFCSLSFFPVSADVLIMKNGEKIQGTVLREEGDHYVVEVKVAPTIRDEKLVPRAEVSKIEKTPEYEKAFATIADLCPAPELLSKEGYEERIKKLKDYIEAFPDSPKIKHVEGMIKSLEEEMILISGGAIKFGEAIISAEEYQANAYELDARIAEKKIRDAVIRRDFLGALRGFDSYETKFGTPEGHAGLSALMVQVLGAYSASIAESLSTLESRLATRTSGLARMSPDDRAKSQRALDAELSQLAERFAQEKTDRMKWITPHVYHKDSLEEAQRQVTAELARLDKREPEPAVPLAELYRAAWASLQTATAEEKQLVLEEVAAKKLPETYLAKLREFAALPQE